MVYGKRPKHRLVLAARARKALPALIELLNEPSVDIAWQAEELLHRAAGEEAPEEAIGANTPERRRKCVEMWRDWWRAEGSGLDLRKAELEERRPTLVLMRYGYQYGGNPEREGYVWLSGCNGRVRWLVKGLKETYQVQLLPETA
jgi:hypothetical protein